jgi:hypothetical protein
MEGRISPGPCVRCGKQGPWDDLGPGRQHPSVLEPLAAQWYFERDKTLPFSAPNYKRPVCPDCTTWDDKWEQTEAAREMIASSRAKGLELSQNEKMWLGEIAEIAAHLKLDREERQRLFGEEPGG